MSDAPTSAPPVRVVVLTTDHSGRPLDEALAAVVPLGQELEVGREGDLQVAVEPEDSSVSRVALTVRPRADGTVDLTVGNLNGVVLHPWGGRSRYLAAGPDPERIAGRVGVRVIGAKSLDDEGVRVYWALVEAAPGGATPDRPLLTVQNARPDALTDAQRDAVALIFREHLAWPPLPAPQALTIDAAARRLGVSPAAVTQRLEGVRKKAYLLGMAQQYGVVDPEYVAALAAHGYLPEPDSPVAADELELFG